jgi:tetratricopeptide (TPR) repeat protein
MAKDREEEQQALQAQDELQTDMGGLRAAAAMVRYARPLIEMAHSEKDLKTFMNLAFVCWNLALMPPAERARAMDKAIADLKLDELGSQLQRAMLQMMIRRHEELFPLMHRERGTEAHLLTPSEEARRLLLWGWEYLEGEIDLDEAQRHFEQALALDAQLADAHNGLAEVAALDLDDRGAETHYRSALELAKAQLGSDAPDAHDWGLDPKTTPYLRAREGLALRYEEQERYDEAIAEYRACLERDRADFPRIRYRVPTLHLLKRDVAGAMRAFDEFAQEYPDDPGDTLHRFHWGLTLCAAGRTTEAVAKLRLAFFSNQHIAPILLGEQEYSEGPDEDEEIDDALDYAWDYEDFYAHLWDERPEVLALLGRLWREPEIQADLQRVLQLREQIATLDPITQGKDWEELDEQLQALEEKELSPELLQRVLGEITE